jgi:predicted DNA binding CopG/RHH family protein
MFVESADLAAYDLRRMQPVRFEFAPKEARINMRLPGELLRAVKAAAQRSGIPYQRYIRRVLERSVTGTR